MTKHTLHPRIPKLRFPEFVGEWEERKLGEIGKKINSKNTDLSINLVLTNSATYGIISQRDYFNKDIANQSNLSGYYLVKKDDFVYNPRISIFAPVGPIKRNNLGTGVMSPLYTVFRFYTGNLTFFEKYFTSTFWYKFLKGVANYGVRHDRMNINDSDFFKLPLPFPSLPEQQKIASFLSIVDDKIEHLRVKKELLEKYKKGVMQGIFSRKIRFRDERGEEFGEWEERKLGEIGETFNGLTGKSGDDFGYGKPFITYKQIFDNPKINISKFAFVSVHDGEKQNKVKYGDIFFTVSSETPKDVGMSAVLLDDIKEDLYLNSFCFGFRINSFNILLPQFAKLYFRYQDTRKKIIILAQGSTRYNISKNQIMKIRILLPSLPEQQKIADFLSGLDDKIEKVGQELESAERWKKGLLQGMFV